jgi:hypothetical protein
MWKPTVVLILLCLGCQPRQSPTSNILVDVLQRDAAGWENVCTKVSPETRDTILHLLPNQYFQSGVDYNYFRIHHLTPLTNGTIPVVLETRYEDEQWVRVFTFQANRLTFITEFSGSVFGVKRDSASSNVRMIVHVPQPHDSTTVLLEEIALSASNDSLHSSTLRQYKLKKSALDRLAEWARKEEIYRDAE